MTLPTNPFSKYRNRFYIFFVLENSIENIGNPGGIVFTSMLLYLVLDEAQIAILMSIAGLSTLLQIFSTLIYQKTTHKKRIILTLFFSRTIALLLIGLMPFFFAIHYYFPILFILLLGKFSFLHLIGGGLLEWNDSHVPEGMKGRYYGRRNAIANGSFIIITFTIGIILDRFQPSPLLYLGFFTATLLAYFLEFILLLRIPIIKKEPRQQLSLKEVFHLPLTDKKYRSFILFSMLWVFALSLGKPLLNVYAIKYMNYSYSIIATTMSVTAFIKIFSGVFFGHLIDRKGDAYVVKLCGIGFALFSLMYIFIQPGNPFIYVIGTIGLGIFMIGFNVAKFRRNMKLANGSHMNTYLSANSFFAGLATFISLNVSGYIINLFKNLSLTIGSVTMNSYQLLFMLSGAFHLLAVTYFVRTQKERT